MNRSLNLSARAFQPSFKILFVLVAALLLFACAADEEEAPPPEEAPSSTFVSYVILPPDPLICPSGGARIDSGFDTNGNGVLDPEEVTSSEIVCNGLNTLVSVIDVLVGDSTCPAGGVRLDFGIDDNGNGTLDPGEIDATRYVCNSGLVIDSLDIAAEVDEARWDLEALLAKDEAPFGDAADVFAKFDLAATFDPINEEAGFFSSLGQPFLFLDSGTTSDLLHKLGLLRFRDEASLCDGFDDPGDPFATNPCPLEPFSPVNDAIIGGTDSFVDLSFSEVEAYAFAAFPDALAQAVARLGGLGTDFQSSLLHRTEGITLEFDFTDVKLIEAMFGAIQIPFVPAWNFTGLDEFITAKSVRDPDTGVFTDEITNSEIEDYFELGNDGTANTSDEPLTVNQTGVDRLASLFAGVFGALESGIGSLLSETDDQSDDVVTVLPEFPEYDAQEQVEALSLELFQLIAGDLNASFASTTPTVVNDYRLVFFFTDIAQCDPLAGDGIPDTGGRNFTTTVFKATGQAILANFVQVLGDFWDNSNRASLVLDDPNTPFVDESTLNFDTTTVENEIRSVLPDATITITDPFGIPVGSITDVFQDDIVVVEPAFDAFIEDTSFTPITVCANPLQFNLSEDFPGGFEL